MKVLKYILILFLFICFNGNVGATNTTSALEGNPTQEVKIYPIPVLDNKFSITSEDVNIIGVKVLNVLGQPVYVKNNLNANTIRIDLETKDKGLYIVQVLTADRNLTTKRILFK